MTTQELEDPVACFNARVAHIRNTVLSVWIGLCLVAALLILASTLSGCADDGSGQYADAGLGISDAEGSGDALSVLDAPRELPEWWCSTDAGFYDPRGGARAYPPDRNAWVRDARSLSEEYQLEWDYCAQVTRAVQRQCYVYEDALLDRGPTSEARGPRCFCPERECIP
jgi:hypothetical protein